MSIVLYFEVLVFVFGELFVLFCVPSYFMLLFSGFWVFFSLLFGSFGDTLPLIVIGVRSLWIIDSFLLLIFYILYFFVFLS
jgi:hypothetical protein